MLVMAMLAAACSDVSSDDSTGDSGATARRGATGAVPDNSDVTIKLAVNAWVGAEANANVAANLLRDKLGYTVELVKIDEFEQFPALARVTWTRRWRCGRPVHPKDYKDYIQADAGVIDAGPLGVVGQIGWFIPTYMLDDHPELATWEGLKGNEWLFATSETGTRSAGGRRPGVRAPSTSRSPTTWAWTSRWCTRDRRRPSRPPWTRRTRTTSPFCSTSGRPHWAQAKYDLTMVELPEITPACEDAAANDV